MRKFIVNIGLLLSLSIATVSTAFAADTGNITIMRIAPWAAGTQLQIPSQVNCGAGSTNQLVIPNGGPDTVAGRNFALAMAAFLAGKTVNINWGCSGTTPTVISVRF